ncbi:MAG: hypothetical protein D6729_17085, partial [Deltaproteobacteria bacterium]
MGRSWTERRAERLDEAFFFERAGRGNRRFILPLAPVAVLWGLATVLSLSVARTPREDPASWHRPDASRLGAAVAPSGFAHLAATPGSALDGRRVRQALTLLRRGEAQAARRLLLRLHAERGDLPYVLRPLARAERAVGHRERAAELYVRLLQHRSDDTEALRFFLAYRYEDDDLDGALAIADELAALGGLDEESALLAARIRA